MSDELLFLPLGGAGEIGMNLNLYGFGPPDAHRWMMIDLGITFGDGSLPGVDVLMPDVKHCGGLQELRAIASAARGQRLLIAPHNPSGPVASVASAHVVSTLRNFLILEYAWGEVPWRHALLDPPEEISDGRIVLSDRPGLGHLVNFNTVEAHRKAI